MLCRDIIFSTALCIRVRHGSQFVISQFYFILLISVLNLKFSTKDGIALHNIKCSGPVSDIGLVEFPLVPPELGEETGLKSLDFMAEYCA